MKTITDWMGNLVVTDDSILEKIRDKRIFQIVVYDEENKFYIVERCDDYFAMEIGVKECKEIAEAFNKLADFIEKRISKESN